MPPALFSNKIKELILEGYVLNIPNSKKGKIITLEEIYNQVKDESEEQGEGKNEILKLKMNHKEDGTFKTPKTFYVVAKTMTQYIPIETYDDDEVIQFKAYIYDQIVDMSNDKLLAPWNFKLENLSKEKNQNVLIDWCLVTRASDVSIDVEDITDTLTIEEKNICEYFQNSFLKIGNDEVVEYGDGRKMFIYMHTFIL